MLQQILLAVRFLLAIPAEATLRITLHFRHKLYYNAYTLHFRHKLFHCRIPTHATQFESVELMLACLNIDLIYLW